MWNFCSLSTVTKYDNLLHFKIYKMPLLKGSNFNPLNEEIHLRLAALYEIDYPQLVYWQLAHESLIFLSKSSKINYLARFSKVDDVLRS